MEDHFHSKVRGRKERSRSSGLVVLMASWMDLKNTLLTGNSTQYSVMTYMGKESKKELDIGLPWWRSG